MVTTSTAPYRHQDGTNCYTKNCSLGHLSPALQAAKRGDVSGYLKSRAQETKQKQTFSPNTFRMLEYGSDNYKLFVQKSEELTEKITPKELQSVMEYTGWAYQQYYGYLEGKNSDGTEFGSQYDEKTRAQLNNAVQNGVTHMDSLINKAGKLNKPVAVFRGEKAPKGVSVTEHIARNFPVGQSVNIKRFLSTSMDPKVASEITGEDTKSSYILVIRTKEGAMLGEHVSEHGLREKEVILPRDRSYKVEKVSSDVVQWGSTRRKHTTVYLTMD